MNTEVDIKRGLTQDEVNIRKANNLVNYNSQPTTKSIKEIISSNVFTYFNFLNLFLGLAVIIAGVSSGRLFYSLKNCLFLGIAICNTIISITQEIISKRVIDKLSVIASSKVLVRRDYKDELIEFNKIVLDDIIILKNGNQVVCDSIIKEGVVEVNESFITGEADTIVKKTGDILLSGSFIVSGNCISKVKHIGVDNYINKISSEAKYIKENDSIILKTFEKIVKILSFVIIPLGIALFLNQYFLVGSKISDSIINTVAALIGMIPEGLVLLTSSVMAVSIIRLGKYKVLVQQLYCIETLSRVDVICLDKTGTITTGNMQVYDIIPNHGYTKKDFSDIILKLINTLDDDTPTFKALRKKFTHIKKFEVKDKIPFSSERKFSAVRILDTSYYIGAYEYIFKNKPLDYSLIKDYQDNYRILVVAKNKLKLTTEPSNLELIGFILLDDEIRRDAKETLDFFKKQGVNIKILSGDNPKTVVNIAKRANLDNLKAIDASNLNGKNIKKIVSSYDIFGRVTPSDKKKIILTLKELGYKVAMTGDGVNDVLALKEADCSIAMSSGSDAAKAVSQIVLLDNNFEAMPKIVLEGRRTINNIERSASLLLVKTIYTILTILTCLFTNQEYFFIPIQLTLITTTTIGIPSFILALEPNTSIVKGDFLLKIFKNSLPAGLTVFLNIIIIIILKNYLNLPSDTINLLAVFLTASTGFIHLYKISRPFNYLRSLLFIILLSGFIFGSVFNHEFFNLARVNYQMLGITLILATFSLISYSLIQKLINITKK